MKSHFEKKSNERDFLWIQISELPYFRGLLRAVEARFYQDIEMEKPILDLGCGDGHFASTAFNSKIDVGIDPWKGPVRQAHIKGSYHLVINGEGNHLPFPDATFQTVISNSVLEHIEDLQPVLEEVSRIIKPGGKFIFCVPNHNFLNNLSVSNFFDRIKLKIVGDQYRKFFNRISRHHHCDSPDSWSQRMLNNRFKVVKWFHYFSPQALSVLEWGHYFGLPSLICKFLFKKWIIVPARWNLVFTERITRKFYEEKPNQEKGSYSFFITVRQ